MNTTCEKISYETEEEAKEHLIHIVETNWNRHKVPCRYYKCKCGKYHLTSKPTVTNYEEQKVHNRPKTKTPRKGFPGNEQQSSKNGKRF